MPRKSMTFRLDDGLVARVDVAAAAAGVNRTAFLEAALELALGGSPVAGLRGVLDVDASGADRAVRVVSPARVVGPRGAASSVVAKRNVSPRWRGGVEGSV